MDSNSSTENPPEDPVNNVEASQPKPPAKEADPLWSEAGKEVAFYLCKYDFYLENV